MIRILALDDDNHDVMFAMENGTIFNYSSDLLRLLAQPHSEEYEIRGFCLIDYEGPATELDEEVVDELFSIVEGVYSPALAGYTFQEAFETLWASSTERWRG